MLVCGDQWPIFLYAHHAYDPEDPWCGLLRSRLLVYVSAHSFFRYFIHYRVFSQAYKHVFTSPSSVDREPKATRSGNARLHGMNSVTIASLAYIATQVRRALILSQNNFNVRLKVRFALSSSSVFSRTDTTTDSETFYHSLLDLLEDPEEYKEIDELLTWWNRYFFRLSQVINADILSLTQPGFSHFLCGQETYQCQQRLIQDPTKTHGPQTSFKSCLFIILFKSVYL
jgi:hypothetical protein